MNYTLRIGELTVEVAASPDSTGRWRLQFGADEVYAEQAALRGNELSFTLAGRSYRMHAAVDRNLALLSDGQAVYHCERLEAGAEETQLAGGSALVSQMPGKVLAVNVAAGAQVAKGQVLLILEAMKMEHEVCAPSDGVVSAVLKQAGERVMPGDLLVDFQAD